MPAPRAKRPRRRREQIALVLAGGGARGAYEAGALAALAPALAARGQTPTIVVGTSIGALNGSFLAARAHEPFETATAAAVAMWRELGWCDALRPLASLPELGRLLGAGAMFADVPGAGVSALLDPSPLRGTLERRVAFEQIERNVDDGTLSAAAVVATAYASTRSVVFHHGGPQPGLDPLHAIDYAATPLEPAHVLASAAIPGAFPAIEIHRPPTVTGWYGDGGVRLNAPLSPAITLGADRVVVIGLNSSVTHAGASRRPDALDGIAQLLQVALADQLADDVARLAAVNETLAAMSPSALSAATSAAGSSTRGRAGPGVARAATKAPHRKIPYIFIAPDDRLEIGRLAREIYKDRYTGAVGFLRDSNLALLGRFVNADHSAIHGELLSYLFLAREFVDGLIELGERHATRWLETRHDARLWQVRPPPAVDTALEQPGEH
jgi:NTE family protein